VRRLFDLWLALGARGPREVVITARRRRRLRPILADLEPRFDVVVASHLGMAALRPRRPAARWVPQLHHVSSAKADQERAVTPGRRQQWLLAREATKARRFERWLLRSFDTVVLVSDGDAEALGPSPTEARVVIAANGVDTAHYVPSPRTDEPVVVMTGSFQYGPNVDGAVWFCDEVLPRIQAAVPSATLDLVGHSPRAEVRALAARAGVELHPDVPSMAPWLSRARVCVVPLRIGTGTRLKALEAMAAGRPVVGTSVGLEGLGLVDGTHAHVVDDPAAFADAVIRVLTDDDHAEALATAGRALVEERFQWTAIGDGLARHLLAGSR